MSLDWSYQCIAIDIVSSSQKASDHHAKIDCPNPS